MCISMSVYLLQVVRDWSIKPSHIIIMQNNKAGVSAKAAFKCSYSNVR